MFDELTTIERVQALIDGGVRESQTLEYKTASAPFGDKEKNEVAKDVSAMANSGGGTIIYGLATDQNDRTLPTAIQEIHVRNIETFDRVVNSQVRPPVAWRKRLLPEGAPRVMVVDVLASTDPPHQSLGDKRYYRRSGTESLPMEHDVVALHFGRRVGPILALRMQTLVPPSTFEGTPPFSNEARLRIFLENSGRKVARFTSLVLKFPSTDSVRVFVRSGPGINIDALYPGSQARQYTDNVGVIHPSGSASVLEIGFAISRAQIDDHPDEPFVTWFINADEMPPRESSASLREIGWAPVPD